MLQQTELDDEGVSERDTLGAAPTPHLPVGLVDDKVSPSYLVEGRLLDVGNFVGGDQDVPGTLVLRRSWLELVLNDGSTLVLTTKNVRAADTTPGGPRRLRQTNRILPKTGLTCWLGIDGKGVS